MGESDISETPAESGSSQEQHARRQHEIMCRVLAESVVAQLLSAGCDAGELIDFGGEVLRIITERGFAAGADESPENGPAAATRQRIRYGITRPDGRQHYIHGPRVTLRPLAATDLPLLAAWQEDAAVRQSFSTRLLGRLTGETTSEPRRPANCDFVICDESGQGIGLISLHHVDMDVSQAELAKLIGAPNARGKGYAREATSLALGYAFDELGLGRVYLRTAGFNLHNIRLNEKIGFRFEGILRGSDVLAGRRVDVVLMSILRREFRRLFVLDKQSAPD